MKWEWITDSTDRMAVPGGWLIRETLSVERESYNDGGDYSSWTQFVSVALTFVPDPGHMWNAESPSGS